MALFQQPVLSLDNAQVGTVDLLAEVFKLEDINKHLIWEAVRHYLAKRRSGTACTKSKWEVSGSGRKLWKQKGTGRARVGSIRSALWKGGSTVHGPKPRSYDYAVPQARPPFRPAQRPVGQARRRPAAGGGELGRGNPQDQGPDRHPGQAWHPGFRPAGGHRGLREGGPGRRQQPRASRTTESLGVNVYDLLKYDQVVFSKEAILALQEVVKP